MKTLDDTERKQLCAFEYHSHFFFFQTNNFIAFFQRRREWNVAFDRLWNNIESFEQHRMANYRNSFLKPNRKKNTSDCFWQGFIFRLMLRCTIYSREQMPTHKRTNEKKPCDPIHGLIFAFFNYSSSL